MGFPQHDHALAPCYGRVCSLWWVAVVPAMRRAWVDDDEMWSPSGTFAGVVGGL